MKRYYLNNYNTAAARDISVIIAVDITNRAEREQFKDFLNRWKNSADPVWILHKISRSTAKSGFYPVKTAAEFFGC